MASRIATGQGHVCRGYRLMWKAVIPLCSCFVIVSAQEYWPDAATRSAKSCVPGIDTQIKMMLMYGADPYCGPVGAATDSGMVSSRTRLWIYPIMYGTEFLVADCSTLLTSAVCQMYWMDFDGGWRFYGPEALYVVSNALLTSTLVAFFGQEVFRHDGSWKLSFAAGLLGSTIHALVFNAIRQDDVTSEEIVTLFAVTFTVPAGFSVVGYNIKGGKQ